MTKKNKPIWAILIANPGAVNVLEAASRLELVTQFLLEDGLKVDEALTPSQKGGHPDCKENC
jgi:hypothetical protein